MNQKEILLNKGLELFSTSAYHATGIREISKSVGISPGSFHYHFKNKEEFAIAIMERWFKKELVPQGNQILFDVTTNSKQKLIKYFEVMIKYHQNKSKEYATISSCMMGNLGQELGNESDPITKKIKAFYKAVDFGITTLVNLGKLDGSIKTKTKPTLLASFIFDSYEGALLRRKITKTDQPLKDFMKGLDTLL